MNKDIAYYMGLPYTVELIPEPQGGWYVGIKELPGCMSEADTPSEALVEINQVKREWLALALEQGFAIPEPRMEAEYSGNFRLRVPHSLHHKLADAAEAEGMSLNSYCNYVLTEAIGGVKNLTKKQ